jgi:hypothetical protein
MTDPARDLNLRWSRPQSRDLPGLFGCWRAHLGQVVANQLRDVGRREMRVVLLRHSRVRVTQGGSHDLEWNAGFGQKARVAMPQDVERDRRLDLGVQTRFAHGPVLV